MDFSGRFVRRLNIEPSGQGSSPDFVIMIPVLFETRSFTVDVDFSHPRGSELMGID
jgi:hypothetical protein